MAGLGMPPTASHHSQRGTAWEATTLNNIKTARYTSRTGTDHKVCLRLPSSMDPEDLPADLELVMQTALQQIAPSLRITELAKRPATRIITLGVRTHGNLADISTTESSTAAAAAAAAAEHSSVLDGPAPVVIPSWRVPNHAASAANIDFWQEKEEGTCGADWQGACQQAVLQFDEGQFALDLWTGKVQLLPAQLQPAAPRPWLGVATATLQPDSASATAPPSSQHAASKPEHLPASTPAAILERSDTFQATAVALHGSGMAAAGQLQALVAVQVWDAATGPCSLQGSMPPVLHMGNVPSTEPPHGHAATQQQHCMDGPQQQHSMDGPQQHSMDGTQQQHSMDGTQQHSMDGTRQQNSMDGPQQHSMDGTQQQHSIARMHSRSMPSEAGSKLSIFARCLGRYLDTRVHQIKQLSHNSCLVVEVMVGLPEDVLQCSLQPVLSITLELWQGERLLSSSTVLVSIPPAAPPAMATQPSEMELTLDCDVEPPFLSCTSAAGSQAPGAESVPVQDSSMAPVAAAADILACNRLLVAEVWDATAIATHTQFARDLGLWLTELQAPQPPILLVAQQQLADDLLQYAETVGLSGIKAFVKQHTTCSTVLELPETGAAVEDSEPCCVELDALLQAVQSSCNMPYAAVALMHPGTNASQEPNAASGMQYSGSDARCWLARICSSADGVVASPPQLLPWSQLLCSKTEPAMVSSCCGMPVLEPWASMGYKSFCAVPLLAGAHQQLGVLCIMDTTPGHSLNAGLCRLLANMAALTVITLERHILLATSLQSSQLNMPTSLQRLWLAASQVNGSGTASSMDNSTESPDGSAARPQLTLEGKNCSVTAVPGAAAFSSAVIGSRHGTSSAAIGSRHGTSSTGSCGTQRVGSIKDVGLQDADGKEGGGATSPDSNREWGLHPVAGKREMGIVSRQHSQVRRLGTSSSGVISRLSRQHSRVQMDGNASLTAGIFDAEFGQPGKQPSGLLDIPFNFAEELESDRRKAMSCAEFMSHAVLAMHARFTVQSSTEVLMGTVPLQSTLWQEIMGPPPQLGTTHGGSQAGFHTLAASYQRSISSRELGGEPSLPSLSECARSPARTRRTQQHLARKQQQPQQPQVSHVASSSLLLRAAIQRQMYGNDILTSCCLVVDTSQPGWPVLFCPSTWRLWSGVSRTWTTGQPLQSLLTTAREDDATLNWQQLQQQVHNGQHFMLCDVTLLPTTQRSRCAANHHLDATEVALEQLQLKKHGRDACSETMIDQAKERGIYMLHQHTSSTSSLDSCPQRPIASSSNGYSAACGTLPLKSPQGLSHQTSKDSIHNQDLLHEISSLKAMHGNSMPATGSTSSHAMAQEGACSVHSTQATGGTPLPTPAHGCMGSSFNLSFQPLALRHWDAHTARVTLPDNAPMHAMPQHLGLYVVQVHPVGVMMAQQKPLQPCGKVDDESKACPASLLRYLWPGLTLDKLLGMGAYGAALHGVWHQVDVAIKVQDLHLSSLEDLTNAKLEVQLGQFILQHPNIVHMLGHATVQLPSPAPSTQQSMPSTAPSPTPGAGSHSARQLAASTASGIAARAPASLIEQFEAASHSAAAAAQQPLPHPSVGTSTRQEGVTCGDGAVPAVAGSLARPLDQSLDCTPPQGHGGLPLRPSQHTKPAGAHRPGAKRGASRHSLLGRLRLLLSCGSLALPISTAHAPEQPMDGHAGAALHDSTCSTPIRGAVDAPGRGAGLAATHSTCSPLGIGDGAYTSGTGAGAYTSGAGAGAHTSGTGAGACTSQAGPPATQAARAPAGPLNPESASSSNHPCSMAGHSNTVAATAGTPSVQVATLDGVVTSAQSCLLDWNVLCGPALLATITDGMVRPMSAHAQLHSPSGAEHSNADVGARLASGAEATRFPAVQQARQLKVQRSNPAAISSNKAPLKARHITWGPDVNKGAAVSVAARDAAAAHAASSPACGPTTETSAASYPLRLRCLQLMEYCNAGTLQAAIDSQLLHCQAQEPPSPNMSLSGASCFGPQTLEASCSSACGAVKPRLRQQLLIAGDICSALAYMHSLGIVHADLSATNVLLVRCSPRDQEKVSTSSPQQGLHSRASSAIQQRAHARALSKRSASQPGPQASLKVTHGLRSKPSRQGSVPLERGIFLLAHGTAEDASQEQEMPPGAFPVCMQPGQQLLLGKKAHSHIGCWYTAKVADLGKARRVVAADGLRVDSYGTVTHQAPEVLLQCLISPAADMYAVGVLLWQMYTGQRAWRGMVHQQVCDAVVSGRRLAWPVDTPPALLELGQACCSWDPAHRPTAQQALHALHTLLDQVDSD